MACDEDTQEEDDDVEYLPTEEEDGDVIPGVEDVLASYRPSH